MESDRWNASWRLALGTGLSLLVLSWVFVVVADPHRSLHLSPPMSRAPIDPNQRFSYPAIARDPAFDSAVIGTSTVRLLDPGSLGRDVGGRFANLAMNSATAYEEWRMGRLFLRHHPRAATVVLGIDVVWCRVGERFERYTKRTFPEWMYDANPWNDYLHLLNGKMLEQSVRQWQFVMGLRAPRYRFDGYRNFLPGPREYDLARARQHLYGPRGRRERALPPQPARVSARERASWRYPTHGMLEDLLSGLPRSTRAVLLFVPYHRFHQPVPGSVDAVRWDECKARVATMAAGRPRTRALDFMIDSGITRDDASYWDSLHYTTEVADRLSTLLGEALEARVGLAPETGGLYRDLLRGR